MGENLLHPNADPAARPGPPRLDGARVEDELRAVLRVSSAVAAAHRLEDVIEIVAEVSCAILGAASVTISRWERDANRLRTLINVGKLAPKEERWPESELWSLERLSHVPGMLDAHRSYVIELADPAIPDSERAMLESIGKTSCLRVPIVFDGVTWGTLEAFADASSSPFTVDDAPFVEALATQVAVAIARAELFSRVAALAYEDPLTGLANRRALEERLETAVDDAAVVPKALSLLFCDLDGLKEINDADGHEAGDAALVRAATALTEAAAAYEGAFISRIGGDEFCVLLDGHGAGAARALALAAEQALAGPPRLSMSCGAAELQNSDQRPADLFRAADAAQYVAKRAGRGRVYVAETGVAAIARPAGQRRQLRDAGRPGRGLAARVLERLEHELAGAPVRDRLEAVTASFADAFDASGWAISWRPAGSRMVRTVFEGGRRALHVSGTPSLRFSGTGDEYLLDDYPATAAVMERGGSFAQWAADPAGDPAECALLERAGHHGVVGAAIVHTGATWLVELYCDRRTRPIEDAVAELRLLMAEAARSGM